MLQGVRVVDDFRQFLDGELRKIRHSLQILFVRDLMKFELCLFRLRRLLLRNLARFLHRIEHLIAPLGHFFVILERIITVRAADNSREKRRFGQSQLRNVLAEINARRFADAVNRNARLLSEINLVGVKRENLLFRQARFENYRHIRLFRLARVSLLAIEPEIFD